MAAAEERFLSTEEVAERLQVDEQTVRRWIKSGKLEAFKPGREWRIPPTALDELLESYSSPKAQASELLEWALAAADIDTLRHRLKGVPTEQLRGQIKAFAGNQRHKTLEDMRSREGMNEAVAQSLLMLRATILRDELLRREDEDPRDYLPDLRKHLDALDLD